MYKQMEIFIKGSIIYHQNSNFIEFSLLLQSLKQFLQLKILKSEAID